jgi:tetrahydromethanopterin S-methyltransferase subunit F
MNWLKELFWDSGMSTRDNLALLALGIVSAFVLYVVLLLVMTLG